MIELTQKVVLLAPPSLYLLGGLIAFFNRKAWFGSALIAAVAALFSSILSAQPLEPIRTFESEDARQGVAVSENYIYAVNNASITQYDKDGLTPLRQWQGPENGPIKHLDSGVIIDNKLYAAHSNYPEWPMTSSVEIWDAESLEHIDSHSFGIQMGSFTWLDRHNGHWWGGFANYDKVQDFAQQAYGLTSRTQIVKMNDDFQVLERWILPEEILSRMTPMSNSGGSWGPDGLLYLSGHDHAELYAMQLPKSGPMLHLVETVPFSGFGQGIAWDRSEPERLLWGIIKSERKVVLSEIEKPVAQVQNEVGLVKTLN